MELDEVTAAYVECAVWADLPEEDDAGADVASGSLARAREVCADFTTCNAELIERSGLSAEQVGHDLYLTRCHHGTGFWDRGLGAIGDQLTELAHAYGEAWVITGDDGLIYIDG